MTESQTPSIVVPIGRDFGAHYDAFDELTYTIAVGDRVHRLGSNEYSIWRLAHGVAGHEGLWKRTDVLGSAEAEDIRDAEAIFDRLCTEKLLYVLLVGSDDMLDFAVAYRPVPLVLGMTAVLNGTKHCGVAIRERILVETDEIVYQVFIWAALFNELWSNCERLGRLASRGAVAIDERWRAPEMIAQLFLTECHRMLAVQALCFDVDPAIRHSGQVKAVATA